MSQIGEDKYFKYTYLQSLEHVKKLILNQGKIWLEK